MNIEEHLAGLDDAALKDAFSRAENDLQEAAEQQPNSDWHQSCFAAMLLYGQELSKRGIRMTPLH